MRYEIYLDVILFRQLVLNCCVLFLSACMRGMKVDRKRILPAVLSAGMIGTAVYLPLPIPYVVKSIMGIVLSLFLLSLIAYPAVSWENYCKNCAAIVFATFFLGGISTLAFHKFRNLGGEFLCTFFPVLLTPACCFGISKIRRRMRMFYPVSLYFDSDTVVSTVALADTGNRLEDEDGNAVCILSQKACPKNFTADKVIVYQVLGNRKSTMRGGMLKKMVIHTQEGVQTYEKIPVAIYPGEISSDGKYEMILQSNYCMRE